MQILLNQSLQVVPKLSNEQIAILSIAFFFRFYYCKPSNHKELSDFLERNLKFSMEKIDIRNSNSMLHLVSAGCGVINHGSALELNSSFRQRYKGLFNKGFEKEQVDKMTLPDKLKKKFIMPCINDNSKFQISALNNEDLERMFIENCIDDSYKKEITALYDTAVMNFDEMKSKILEFSPFMNKIFTNWTGAQLIIFLPTNLGKIIGNAYLKQHGGWFDDLEKLIN